MKTIKNAMKLTAIVVLAMTLTFCTTDNNKVNNDKPSAEFMQKQNDFKSTIEAEVNKIDREIERINRKIENRSHNVGDEIEEEWNATRKNLIEWKNNLQKEADRTANITEKEWNEFKQNVEKNIEDAEDEFEKLGEKIKDAFTIEDNG